MESVKKMMLVDPRVLGNMKESNIPQPPLVKVVSDLDTQMNDVLARTDLSPSEKVRLHDQILQRFIVYNEKLTEKPAQVVVSEKKDFRRARYWAGLQNNTKNVELLDII